MAKNFLNRAAVVICLAAPLAAFAAQVPVPKIETPPDVTIYQTAQGPVFATKSGMTLYKKLPNVGSWALAAGQANSNGVCAYQCPTEFPPLIAGKDAKPVGDFTIVVNSEKQRQWAYKGVLLETFKFDRAPGDTMGEDTFAFNGPRRPYGEAAWIESDVALLEPPPIPEPTQTLPPGITVQRVFGSNRVFANAEGLTLYSQVGVAPKSKGACTTRCTQDRRMISAASFARPIGDWTILEDEFGVRQWAYKGSPVYTYAGDREAHAIEGEAAGWKPVFEYTSPLPPEVALGATETGQVYVDKATQKTLYFQGFAPRPYEMLGFNHPKYRFGTVSCHNECAEKYPPLLARDDAKPVGEWWIATRLDGKKQWAWRGVPVYSYAEDVPERALAAYKNHRWAVLSAE